MRRPDLIILVVVWEFIAAFLALLGFVAMAALVFPALVMAARVGDVVGLVCLSIGMVCLLCFLGVAIAGGIGLLQGREWGRIVSIVHAAFTLFIFPFGTIIGILVLIYLLSADVVAYFQRGREA